MRSKISFILLAFFLCQLSYAQMDNDSSVTQKITISGFADVFYAYDLNEPDGEYRQAFLYNHNRHNEFSLNLGLIKLAVRDSIYRANLAIQAGTYANDNYINESETFKNVFEANVGIALNKKKNIWLDAGIFPSHLGFESAISIENMTLSRSLLAENSPYFLSGAQLSLKTKNNWKFTLLVANGWQRIKRVEGNSLPSFGSQVAYSPSTDLTINWSTFVGTEFPDSSRRMMYFNDLYVQFKSSEKLSFIVAFDIGLQEKPMSSSEYDIWFGPTLIAEYMLNEKWKTALRLEYYDDENGVIIPTSTINGFKTSGISLNLDHSPSKDIMCRIEGRYFNSEDEIFELGSIRSNSNFTILGSIAFKISESFKRGGKAER